LIIIDNRTDFTFKRGNYSIPHGVWGKLPTEQIPSQSRIEFGTMSNGFMTGTEGVVYYQLFNRNVRFSWNNPYLGKISYFLNLYKKQKNQKFENSFTSNKKGVHHIMPNRV